ncbi:MAG: winged helix-turn-helix transcriptional regulator [Oscillospiraceae bacterium]|nr:winged helix-turn-helix transcriptional regulator [Oscillospiraceae bacterium]
MENANCNHTKHKDIMEKAAANVPSNDKIALLADFFKVFGDSTRLKIIALLRHTPLSVCCIADCLNMEQSAISHQLKVLRQNHIVAVEKQGKQSIYSLSDLHVELVYEMGLDHIMEGK